MVDDNSYKFLYKPELLETIKDMLSENLLAMKCVNSNSDYLDGQNVALKELCQKLELCDSSEIRD